VDPAEAIKFYYRFASDGLQFNAYQEVNNTLSIQIKEHFQQLTVRIKAVDKAGNFIEKDFTAGVIDPVIAVSDLITQPLKVEELTSAWLRAEVSGDSDLVTGVDMQVNGRWFHAGYHMNGALGSIELNYMNPRLANIAPAEHIQVLIRVRYGFSGVKELVRQYPLHMDATPPQVSIVSPKDGDKLPIGEVAEVVIQSFDKYGIEDVQISVDGGVYQSLTQVNLFQFIPTSEDVVTLQARANDPNGNLGTSAVVRVNPFDPEKGEPELSILSPDNGDNAKEGQAIELELLMRHIEQAELKVLVGADNNDPRNPASLLIERTEGEPERFKYRLQLPNTDENIVVLLELTSGDMVARSFLNLLRDTGIEAETDLVITPAKHVLSGTGLRVIGQVPAQMDDFNSSSSLVITDGDAPDKLFKLAPVDALVAIGAQGALVTIKAQLKDLSGHVQLSEVKLTKQAYLSDSPQESADLTGSSDRIVAVSESLTLDGEDTWLGIQSKQAGFSVRKDNIQVFSQPSGELVTLEASAYGAYGIFNNQGDQKLFILTADKGVYESQLVSLAGDLVGVNGDLVVMKQGRLITGLRLQDSPTPLIGHMMDDDIKSVSIWRNQVWVLTQEKLQLLGLDELGHKLKPVASFYITDLDNLAVGADDIYLWRNETLKHYKLTDELELVQLNEVNLGIKLSQPQFDGNILWLNGIDSIHGGSHVAIREGEVVGILPWQQPIEVGVNQLYRIDGQGVQSYRLTGRPVQLTALALEGLATEVLIKGVDYRLAAGQLMVTDQNDKPLAYRWFDKQTVAISRQAINTDTLKVYISQGETNELVSSFTINNEPLTDLTIITPLLPTVVAKDASLPLFLQYPVNNRIINATMGTRAWEHNESSAALWWHASQRGNYQVDIDVNAQAMPSRLIDVRDNDPADAELRITAPSNNDRYTEGDWLTLRYVTRHMDVAQFKHAELVVTDFNGNEQVRLLSDGLSGQLSVKLAANDQQETYTLRVRAYFGEQYHFAEDAIGIKVIPQRTNLAFEIYGVGERAYADSHLVLSTKSQTSEAGTAELTVKDADGKILASGIEPLSLTVPVTESLVIEASRQDGLGNISTQSKQVLVAEPYKFTAAQSQFGYDHLLRTSSQTYFFSGQKLLDEQGQLLHRFDARVLAAIHVEDRWLLSLDGIGLTFVDPEHDYQILGTYVSIDKFEHMALLGEHLWASNDLGELNYFTIKGNSLELNNQENLGLIKQISVSLDELWVLTADSLYKQELSTQGQLVSVYNGQGLSVFLMSKQVNWLLSQNGDLIRLTSSGELSISKLDVSGGAQLGHAFGDIWTFDKEKQQLILISQHQRDTYVIGRYPLATSGWLSFDKGKLYSSDGQVWDWSVQEYAPRKVYQTQRQRGNTTDVSLRLGKVISANQGFALLSQEGLPNTSIEQTYPTAYTSDIRRLKASDSMVLAYDSASGKIHKLNTDNLQQSSIIAVQPGVTDFEVQGSKLVLAYGDRLKFYDLVSQQSDELPVSAGDDILSLTLDGQFTYVTTLSGGLYRVSTGDLPLDSFDVNIEPLLQGGGAFKQLVSLGDELFFVSNEGIHTFNFTTRQSRLLVNGAVQAMSLAQGYIWYSQGDNLHRLALNLGAVPEFIYQASADISSIALESNQVLLAVGLKGIELVWLDKTAMTVSPALGSPAFDQYYQLGDRFIIELAQPEGVSVAEYYINDIRVATSDSYPFNVDILIPSSLKNGKAFKLKVVIKDYQGHTYVGQEKRLNLQSETLPLNRFNVELSFDPISYVPRPLRFEAKISQSDQPIRQVEFYLADNIAGPYQLMRKHYGPEFVVRRNFTLAQSGKYIKARAVDIYGNFTESAPQVIRRTIDLTKPELSLSLNSRLNEQGKVTNTHPYELNFSLNDQGSGIELALLKRDDKVIWAGFSEGPSSIIESEHQLGETYHYSLTATDKANNSATVALPVTVVEDAYPELNQSRVPVSIIEQGSFNVGLAFSDDVALEKVDIQWPAFEREYPLAGKLTDDNFVVKDIRQQRINTQVTQKLRVLVSDDVQQTSTYEFDITVNPDKSPTPNALTLAVPYAAIYGNLLPISLSGLEAADDAGAAQLNAELEIYYNKVLQQELPLCLSSATRALVCRDTLRKTIQLPEQRVEGDFIEIAVKLTDRLGQMSVGDRKRINLTQKPNLVKFDTNGVASFNSDSVRSGDTAAIQVKVLDISARPVALQKVSFTLIDAKNQRQLMGLVATNESGFARLDMNAAGLQAGHYRIIATLTEYPTIAPAIHLLDILPGDPALLRVRNIAPIMVDNPVELVIEVTDSAENRVFDLDELNVSLAFNHPDFHFGFANNIKISSRYDQDAKYLGETASIAIHQGVANISVSVPKVAGDYLLSLLGSEPEGLALHYQAVGNGDYHSVDNIPVAVLPGLASQLSLGVTAMTNHSLGRADVLEVDETATLTLQLVDEYNNRVTQITDGNGIKQDANLSMSLSVSGNARFENGSSMFDGVMAVGQLVFTLTDASIEDITMRVTDVVGDWGINEFAEIDLSFVKRLPGIVSAQVKVAHNELITPVQFTFTEAVFLGETNKLLTVLDNEAKPVSGQMSQLDDITVEFVPDAALTLNQSYGFSTLNSGLIGVAQGDGVLQQQGHFLSAHVAVTAETQPYLLSLEDTKLELALGDGLSFAQFREGKVWLDEVEHQFDFNQRLISTPKVTDEQNGTLVTIKLVGKIANGESIQFANTLSLPLLTSEGDYDADGISNALEHHLGLNPTLQDSDGNGVADGQEDTDGDGVDNLTELELGSLLDNTDSDGDGLADGIEYELGSDLTKADTDGDGIDDAVEVASGSNPNDANSRAIKPEFVKGLQVTPKNINYNLGTQTEDVTLAVQAQVTVNRRNYLVDVSDAGFFDLVFSSSNTQVAVSSFQGFIPVGLGESVLTVSLGGFSDTALLSVTEAVDLGDVVWQDETVELFGGVSANSVTVIGDVDVVIHGSLSVASNLILKPRTNFTLASEEVVVGGDLNIESGATLVEETSEYKAVNLEAFTPKFEAQVEVPLGTVELTASFATTDGSSNNSVVIYMKHGSRPNEYGNDNQCSRESASCVIHYPVPGTYFVLMDTAQELGSQTVDLTITQKVEVGPSLFNLASDNALTVAGKLSVNHGTLDVGVNDIYVSKAINTSGVSSIVASRLTGFADASVNGVELELGLTEQFKLAGNLSLNAPITAKAANLTTKQLYPIHLNVGQKLMARSSISAEDAGYPMGYGIGFKEGYCLGSHASQADDNCAYGNYKNPTDFGSGSATGIGGGVIWIEANQVEVELPESQGVWLNIGGEDHAPYGARFAAGGSALINTEQLKVINAPTLIETGFSTGGEVRESMSGRVAIYAGEIDIQGEGGGGNPPMPMAMSKASASDIPQEEIIDQLDQLARRIFVAGTVYLEHKQSGVTSFISGAMEPDYGPIEGPMSAPMLAKSSSVGSSSKDEGKDDNFVVSEQAMQGTPQEPAQMPPQGRSLHVVTVGQHQITDIANIGQDLWELTTSENVWLTNLVGSGRELAGIQLRLTSENGALSQDVMIVANTANSVTVASSDDLYQFNLGLLHGLHQFTKLYLGQNISFGNDIVEFELSDINYGEIWAYSLPSPFIDKVLDTERTGFHIRTPLMITRDNLARGITIDAKSIRFTQAVALSEVLLVADELVFDSDFTADFDVKILTRGNMQVLGSYRIDSYHSLSVGGVVSVMQDMYVNASVELALDFSLNGSDFSASSPLGRFNVGGILQVASNGRLNKRSGGGKALAFDSDVALTMQGIHASMPMPNDSSEIIALGDYKRPISAGSGGILNAIESSRNGEGEGAGAIQIQAGEIILNGILSVTPQINYYDSDRLKVLPAAGSILLDTAKLSGTGKIDAYGPKIDASGVSNFGGAGRIAIYTDENTFTGKVQTGSVANRTISVGSSFIANRGQELGRLEIKIGEASSACSSDCLSSWISLPQVGVHQVTKVDALADGYWRLSVDGANWPLKEEFAGFSITNEYIDLESHAYSVHNLKITEHQQNSLVVKSAEDLTLFLGETLVGVHRFESLYLDKFTRLDIGQDKLRVTDTVNSFIGNNVLIKAGQQDANILTWLEQKNVQLYLPEINYPEGLLLGYRQVFAVAADTVSFGARLELAEQSKLDISSYGHVRIEESLILQSNSELSGDLKGAEVEIFGDIDLKNNAKLKFTKSRLDRFIVHGNVYLANNAEFAVDAKNIQIDGELIAAVGAGVYLDASEDITISKRVELGQNYTHYAGHQFTFATMNLAQGASLLERTIVRASAGKINVTGDLDIAEYAKFDLDDRNLQSNMELEFTISGIFTLAENASIDANVSGYRSHILGSSRYCHGGRNRASAKGCEYGNYRRAKYAGLKGTSYGEVNLGGGAIAIQALEVILNGDILANGGSERYQSGGAGGSVHIETPKLSGSGDISVAGGPSANYYYKGGSGRISIHADDRENYSGVLTAATAHSNRLTDNAGAGTIYLADGNGINGSLVIDNTSKITGEAGTDLKAIGLGSIGCVEALPDRLWRITAEYACGESSTAGPWKNSASNAPQSIMGQYVDLDVDDDSNQILEVVSNTENSLVVSSPLDLSSMKGKTFQGIHQLKSISLRNFARVDFGGDRVEVTDIQNSEVMSNVYLTLGAANDEFIELLNQSGASVTWSNN
jgi:large repetitive protein